MQYIIEKRYAKIFFSHYLFLENITTKQQQKIKSFIVNVNNYLNRIFSSFDFLNYKFFLYHQKFIMQGARADYGSYFCNYILLWQPLITKDK